MRRDTPRVTLLLSYIVLDKYQGNKKIITICRKVIRTKILILTDLWTTEIYYTCI